MKHLLLIAVSLFIMGCSEESVESKQRVDVFISMGQSNAVGINTNATADNKNVYMPYESINYINSKITFVNQGYRGINKIQKFAGNGFINTASLVSNGYRSNKKLYVINIADYGKSIDLNMPNYLNHWAINRNENDGNDLHKMTISYIASVLNEIKNQNEVPTIIGIDWNQWEAESYSSDPEYYVKLYDAFFKSFEAILPNKDYKLFICNPTSPKKENRDMMALVFYELSLKNENMIIYRPDELSSNVFQDDEIHYTTETYAAFAEFMLEEMGI